MKDLKEVLEKAKELTEGVVVDLDKPLEDDAPKYTIIKDEASCFGPSWCVNGKWLGEGEYLEQDEELIDYLLSQLKEAIKKDQTFVDDVLHCIQYDDYEADKGDSCETCGHHGGGRTTWKI
jgi:hypothetical protein